MLKRNFKRILLIAYCVLLIVAQFNFSEIDDVYAETTTIATSTDSLNVRSGPSTSYSKIGTLSKGDSVVVVAKSSAENGCTGDYWYEITYENSSAYVCGAYLTFSTVDVSSDFPESYQASIALLQEIYPNATFTAIYTGLDWDDVVENESEIGISLINGSDTSLRSKDSSVYNSSTGVYTELEPGWYAANETTVSYYLDPRNFLDEKYVFMFENLAFDETLHTESSVTAILGDTYMPSLYSKYATTIVTSGSTYDISAIHAASRILQETGTSGSTSTSGESFEYDGQTYSGLYNFFNIGAYGYSSPAIAGLIWANGGSDGSSTTYQRPWTTPELAISGGMQYLSSSYISKGQNTTYFQKFNVSPFADYATYTHQYMTNVKAAYSEASSTYSSYEELGLLDSAFEFLIPVYENMPGESDYPTEEDPDPEEDVYESVSISTIMSTLGVTYDSTYMYGVELSMSVSMLTSSVKSVSSSASVSVKDSDNVSKTGTLATGDVVTITSGTTTSSYTVIIYGDSNGDGSINILDLLRTQKIILNELSLSEAYLKAADNNKDGSVTIIDLLRVQKHILGEITIE